MVIPLNYDEIKINKDDDDYNFARVRLDNRWGIYEIGHKLIVPVKYDKAFHFSESGYAAVYLN